MDLQLTPQTTGAAAVPRAKRGRHQATWSLALRTALLVVLLAAIVLFALTALGGEGVSTVAQAGTSLTSTWTTATESQDAAHAAWLLNSGESAVRHLA
jgi:hypothetical protein